MRKELQIPFGSQHVGLLEPMRFRFTTENETIKKVEADFGYVHRGIEKACTEKFKYKQLSYVVSRVCGLCSITHSSAYTFAVEQAMQLEIPKKAEYLRMLAFELDRVHSHMLCLAHTAESAGYEALFMRVMRDREPVMELQELLTGNRVHFDYTTIGGVNRDFTTEQENAFRTKLKEVEKNILEIYDYYTNNWSLSLRYKGVGALTQEEALVLNATGPLLRATGFPSDMRQEFQILPYGEIGLKVIVGKGGDIHARNVCRLDESINSIEMMYNIMDGMPEGEVMTKVKGNPDGIGAVRVEAPRGELCYYIKGVKKPYLDRVRIKTPTYSNLPAFVHIMEGEEYANVPAIMASLDPCMSCTAK